MGARAWRPDRDAFVAGHVDRFLGLGRDGWCSLASDELRAFFDLDVACDRWRRDAAAALEAVDTPDLTTGEDDGIMKLLDEIHVDPGVLDELTRETDRPTERPPAPSAPRTRTPRQPRRR